MLLMQALVLRTRLSLAWERDQRSLLPEALQRLSYWQPRHGQPWLSKQLVLGLSLLPDWSWSPLPKSVELLNE